MARSDVTHFVNLRKELSKIRSVTADGQVALTSAQRDLIALAQAEALCDIAATLNAGIVVSSE